MKQSKVIPHDMQAIWHIDFVLKSLLGSPLAGKTIGQHTDVAAIGLDSLPALDPQQSILPSCIPQAKLLRAACADPICNSLCL